MWTNIQLKHFSSHIITCDSNYYSSYQFHNNAIYAWVIVQLSNISSHHAIYVWVKVQVSNSSVCMVF